MIASICSDPKVLEVMKYVNIFISIIRIVVPLILIFTLMFKFMSVIKTGNEDELAKVKKTAVVNVIAAVIIFLIPNILGIIIKITFPKNDYNNCLEVDDTVITQAYENRMEKLVINAEETLSQSAYDSAMLYLKNIKDENNRKSYEERLKIVKEKIDELRKKEQYAGTGLGKDIVASEELIEACKWVLHADEIPIRLYTCKQAEYAYKDPQKDLPGGATYVSSTGQYRAKEAIPLSTYQMGVFFGEISNGIPAEARYTWMIIYKTEFLHTTVYHAINRGEVYDNRKITYENKDFAGVYFRAGSCAQNYRNSKKVNKYDSGKYKDEIDDTVENTKYFVIADDAGKDYGRTTNVIYHSYTGIEPQIEKAAKDGKTFVEIIEKVIKSGNDDSHRYKNARVYDCRNLVEDGTIEYDYEKN